MNRTIKLQNLLFPKQELEQHWWMFYRGDRITHDVFESSYCLKANRNAEFFTYFNAFSLEKWKKYTCVEQVYLRLSVKGKIGIQLFGHYMNGNEIERNHLHTHPSGRKEPGSFLPAFCIQRYGHI